MRYSDSKKVALFVPTLRGGGAERVMVNLARGFANQGLDVDLVVRAKGPFISDVPANVRVVDLGASRVLTSIPGLIKYMRKEKPIAMLSAIEHACVAALFAARLARVQTYMVASVHNTISQDLDLSSLRVRLLLRLIKIFYPLADKTVVVSKAARDDFLQVTKLDPKRIKVIYNPVVTPELFKKAGMPVQHPWFKSGEPPVIIGVGRLTKQKDFSTLIRSFALVRQQLSARLLIIGEGEERLELENLAIELGIKEDIDLHGFVENPYAFLAHSAVFVLSSAWEGLPTVLIEALAIGIPVVSTDCPSGPKEILENGLYGTLTPVGDEKQIAQGILKCLLDFKAPKRPAASWERFELDRVSKEYIDVLLGERAE